MDSRANILDISKSDLTLPEHELSKRPEPKTSHWSCIQVTAALAVSIGAMVSGYASAYTSPALESMRDTDITPFVLTKETESWIGSALPLGSVVGGLVGGALVDFFGRRNTIAGTGIPLIGAWLLIAFAQHETLIIVGRSIVGICVGVISLANPVYLGETLHPQLRGKLGMLPTSFGNIAIVFCYVCGIFMDWRYLAIVCASLPVPFFVMMLMTPETPRWYVMKGKFKQAKKSLQNLRGKNSDILEELESLVKSKDETETPGFLNALSDMLNLNNFRILLISLGLMLFQQLSGINAIVFYAKQIFEQANSSVNNDVCSIITGSVNFAAAFLATALIDRVGRKILLYISSVLMILTLIPLGVYFYLKSNNTPVDAFGWIPLVCVVLYVIGFSLGFGPVPWLMMGEILPTKVRGISASVVTSFNFICSFIVTKYFNQMTETMQAYGTFWFFGVCCVFALIFVILFVPETRGRSLEDIEDELLGRKQVVVPDVTFEIRANSSFRI